MKLSDTLDEARRFLALPRTEPADTYRQSPAPTGSPEAARRLFAMSKPIAGTPAETYLRERGITGARNCTALRYHPRCWYRSDDDDPADPVRDSWPALIAAVTDDAGTLTGAHRTWLDPSGRAKAPISTPRRAMGLLLGNGARFGRASDVLAAGEGIEALPLIPALGDFNDDLRQLGLSALADGVGMQLDRLDAERFLTSHRFSRAA